MKDSGNPSVRRQRHPSLFYKHYISAPRYFRIMHEAMWPLVRSLQLVEVRSFEEEEEEEEEGT